MPSVQSINRRAACASPTRANRARTARRLLPLTLAIAISHGWAATQSQTGTDGAPGVHGTAVGQAGTEGQAGGNSSRTLAAPDAYNSLTVQGGAGGFGGNGGAGTASVQGGVPGRGGAGGAAQARTTTVQSCDATAQSLAVGGFGGNAGQVSAINRGPGSMGGAGGDASASSTAQGSTAAATSRAYGGQGGLAYGSGGVGGAGGTATATTSGTATGGSFTGDLIAGGGAGGNGLDGAAGGGGASVELRNAAAGSALDSLVLSQHALGGNGGESLTNAAGRGGRALSELVLTDTRATQLQLNLLAAGGHGGATSSGVAGAGGEAIARLDIVSNGELSLIGSAVGGDGGLADNGPGGLGGAATSSVRGKVNTASQLNISSSAQGGRSPAWAPYLVGSAHAMADAVGGGSVHASADAISQFGASASALASGRGSLSSGSVSAVASSTSDANAIARATSHHTTQARNTGAHSEAWAYGQGASGLADAESTTVYQGAGRAMTLSSGATAPAHVAGALTYARTAMGGVAAPINDADVLPTYSDLVGLPDFPLDTLPSQVASTYVKGYQPLLAHGEVGLVLQPGADQEKAATAVAGLRTHLGEGETIFIGLLGLQVEGQGFGTLSFSVRNGSSNMLLSESFTTLEEAQAYFTDRPITLDGLQGNVDLGLSFTMTGSLWQEARINYVIGVIPEPSTHALMGLAFGGVFAARRWQARRAASPAAG